MKPRSESKQRRVSAPLDVLRLRKVVRLTSPIVTDIYEILPRPQVGLPMALSVPLAIQKLGDQIEDGDECSALVGMGRSSIGAVSIEIDPETHETATFDLYNAFLFRLIAPIETGELGILFD